MKNTSAERQVIMGIYAARYHDGFAVVTSSRGGKCIFPDDYVREFLKNGGHLEDFFNTLRIADKYDRCVEHYGDWTPTLEQAAALAFRRLATGSYLARLKRSANSRKGGKKSTGSAFPKLEIMAIATEVMAKNTTLSYIRIAEFTLDRVAEKGILRAKQKEPSIRQIVRWIKDAEGG